MNLGLHIIQFPSKRFGFVGTIPAILGHEVPATTAAVMGGRSFFNAEGNLVEIKFPSFETEAEAKAFIASKI